MMKSRLGLYFHIPFCVRKCNYCDFLSFSSDQTVQNNYILGLINEINVWKGYLAPYLIDSIYIGGGTPSILSINNLNLLMNSINSSFSLSEKLEFSMECNPGTVDEEKLAELKSAGVNRISFGLQSTNDKELNELGRIHSYNDFIRSYEMARKIGFDNINIDLMSSIPLQTINSYEKSLQEVVGLKPEHVSAYSLIVEEGTNFYEKYKDNPPVDEETDRLMYEITEQILADAGFIRYEISNYAKPLFQSEHNLKYWTRQEYFGFGLGACSMLNHTRLSNENDLENYIKKTKNNSMVVKDIHALTPEEEMSEFMFLGLRCMKGIREKDFYEMFEKPFPTEYKKSIEMLKKQGLLDEKDEYIYLTKKGINISNRVFTEFV